MKSKSLAAYFLSFAGSMAFELQFVQDLDLKSIGNTKVVACINNV